MAATFDTLTAARRMEGAGMMREHAEAVAEAVRAAADCGREQSATKDDVAAVKDEMAAVKTDLAELKIELKGDISGSGWSSWTECSPASGACMPPSSALAGFCSPLSGWFPDAGTTRRPRRDPFPACILRRP